MFLDIGVNRAEAESLGIRVGDGGTRRSFAPCESKVPARKSLGRRIGVAVFLEVLRRLKDENHPNVVYAVSVQRKGLRGAKTSNAVIDIALPSMSPWPRHTEMDNSLKLGAGPAILIYDRSLIAHVGLGRRCRK